MTINKTPPATTTTLASNIKLLILDVDGVLTDGKIWFSPEGTEYKAFNCQDGLGLKRLQQHTTIKIAVISGRHSATVALRLKQLNIEHVFLGYTDKLPTYEKLIDALSVTPDEVCYVGDDLPDLDIMQKIGLSIAVNNAVPTVKNKAHMITRAKGGDGAVREVCDLLIEANT
jgi:3-deoxy-D-manno-octulosonate 8-phosphate phosphatase (KDO 8-P phosphatase)